MSRAAGGLAHSVPGFVGALRDVQTHILGVTDDLFPDDAAEWGPARSPLRAYGPRKFGWAPAMGARLDALAPDMTDAQGLWMYPSLANLNYSTRAFRPYVITPRGMLDPWAVERARWKKRLVGWWFEDAHLGRAACLRAISASEVRSIRAFGLTNPIALVPNGVTLPADDHRPRERAERRTLLFLGRLDPKKGVAELLQAWRLVESEARASGWRLQVTGWGEPAYVARVQKLVHELALDPASFTLTGPAYGDDKARIFADASAFILPSFSEGLPMAVLEAWSHRLPAVLTDACNLPEGFTAGAALRTKPRADAIAARVRRLIRMTTRAREEMGTAGRRLVERDFSWPAVARDMLAVYRWTVGGGPPPTCMLTD